MEAQKKLDGCLASLQLEQVLIIVDRLLALSFYQQSCPENQWTGGVTRESSGRYLEEMQGGTAAFITW